MDTSRRSRLQENIRRCAQELGRNGIGALEQLYEFTAARAVSYAQVVTRNQDDAEDALQAANTRGLQCRSSRNSSC